VVVYFLERKTDASNDGPLPTDFTLWTPTKKEFSKADLEQGSWSGSYTSTSGTPNKTVTQDFALPGTSADTTRSDKAAYVQVWFEGADGSKTNITSKLQSDSSSPLESSITGAGDDAYWQLNY